MKLKASDNMAPVRTQLLGLIEPNASVVEFGCGSGDLLFELAPRIESGLGIDRSAPLINRALRQKEERGLQNIHFACRSLGQNYLPAERYDVAIASLFFHVIPRPEALYLLKKMRELSGTMLICAFSRPETFSQKLLLWLDQRFSGHYQNFKAYRQGGYLETLLAEANYTTIESYPTVLPMVRIYKISTGSSGIGP